MRELHVIGCMSGTESYELFGKECPRREQAASTHRTRPDTSWVARHLQGKVRRQ